MPIRKELKPIYGQRWKKEIRPRILDRADYRCEVCRVPDRVDVIRAHDGLWYDAAAFTWRDGTGKGITRAEVSAGRPKARGELRVVRIVISVCHLDHTPANMAEENLLAVCQYHHLIHDLDQHADTRCERKDAKRGILAAGAITI